MTGTVASAPGKVVVCGEYAVLDGAPAICMAVDRRARVTLNSIDGDWNLVRAPGYSQHEGAFRIRSGRLEWRQEGTRFDLVAAVFDVINPTLPASLCIDLDTREFQDSKSGDKLGLGSSAALAVALSAALTHTGEVLDDSMAAHRNLQQGAGSGVDVAAAVQGGLIEYRRRNTVITPLSWPTDLHFRLLWSGRSASTQEKLARYAAAGRQHSRARLHRAAEDMAAVWRSGQHVLQSLPAYIETLRQFSVDHDLGIFDAGHDQLVADAAAAGLVYKPCGAGGGDIGILLGSSEAGLDEFIAGGRQSPLYCALEPVGVELEQH